MKVLVATHEYNGTGAAIMLLAVVEHWITDLGWTVDVLLDVDKEIPADLAQLGATVVPVAIPEDYDFALVNTIDAASVRYLEMLGPRVPTVLWVHEGETVLWNARREPREWRQIFGLPIKIIFQGPWQSNAIFRSFLTGLPSERIASVSNGLPLLPKDLVAKPKQNGIRRIVFLGGVYGRKRPQDLVEAVLGMERNDLQCIFIGRSDHIETMGTESAAKLRSRPELFSLSGELDRVSALEYLKSADVCCLPSADESQPIAPLEAAALGVPNLLTDLPSYAGIWRHGETCLLHPVGAVSLLRWNLRALLDDSGVCERVTNGARNLVGRFAIRSFYQRFDAELPI
jgi:glycosyltransferase involved in cell wall biosynthesis